MTDDGFDFFRLEALLPPNGLGRVEESVDYMAARIGFIGGGQCLPAMAEPVCQGGDVEGLLARIATQMAPKQAKAAL